MKFAKSMSLLFHLASAISATSVEEATDEPARPAVGLFRRVLNLFNSQKDIIVILKDDRRLSTDASRRTIADIALLRRNEAAKFAGEHNIVPTYTYGAATYGFAAKAVTEQKMAELENDSRVDYVEIDLTIQLDPIEMIPEEGNRFLRGRLLAPKPDKKPTGPPGGGGGGGQPVQETPWGITRVNGGVTCTGSCVAWVLDTGVDVDHPDLIVDDSRGFNAFTSGKDGRNLDDGNGHGKFLSL